MINQNSSIDMRAVDKDLSSDDSLSGKIIFAFVSIQRTTSLSEVNTATDDVSVRLDNPHLRTQTEDDRSSIERIGDPAYAEQ